MIKKDITTLLLPLVIIMELSNYIKSNDNDHKRTLLHFHYYLLLG